MQNKHSDKPNIHDELCEIEEVTDVVIEDTKLLNWFERRRKKQKEKHQKYVDYLSANPFSTNEKMFNIAMAVGGMVGASLIGIPALSMSGLLSLAMASVAFGAGFYIIGVAMFSGYLHHAIIDMKNLKKLDPKKFKRSKITLPSIFLFSVLMGALWTDIGALVLFQKTSSSMQERDAQFYQSISNKRQQLLGTVEQPNEQYVDEYGYVKDGVLQEYCAITNNNAEIYGDSITRVDHERPWQNSGQALFVPTVLSNALYKDQYTKGCLSLEGLEEKITTNTNYYIENPDNFRAYVEKFSWLPASGIFARHQKNIEPMTHLKDRDACTLALAKITNEEKLPQPRLSDSECDSASKDVVPFDKIDYYLFKWRE